MSQLILQRVERKYLVDEGQYLALSQALAGPMEEDRYSDYLIHNIYYDAGDDALIRASLDKPVYKEKLRLRCYGQPAWDGPCFVELKKKFRGVVYKRRLELTLDQARRWLDRREPLAEECQISREIEWVRDFYPLAPRMVLIYHRLAFHGREDPDLRLTFDDGIRWRDWDLDLTHPAAGRDLLTPGQRLMELKVPGAMPLWLSGLLSELAVYPASFSKYGRAYQERSQLKTERTVTCA